MFQHAPRSKRHIVKQIIRGVLSAQVKWAIGLSCTACNTAGAYHYAMADFDSGSALFNIGCTGSGLLGAYDLCTEKLSGHQMLVGSLNCAASFIFDAAVICYYSVVMELDEGLFPWLGGFGFVLGSWVVLISDRISAKFDEQVVGNRLSSNATDPAPSLPFSSDEDLSESQKILLALREEVSHCVFILFAMGAITFIPINCEVPGKHHLGSWIFFTANAISIANGIVPFMVKMMGAGITPRTINVGIVLAAQV